MVGRSFLLSEASGKTEHVLLTCTYICICQDANIVQINILVPFLYPSRGLSAKLFMSMTSTVTTEQDFIYWFQS